MAPRTYSHPEALRRIVDNIETIPSLPHIVMRIMEAIDNPRTSADDINDIILTDPAITAKVLRLVNSAFYGFPRRIASVTQAVVILGFSTVRNLVLTATIFDVFNHKNRVVLDREALWQHSMATAVISRLVARRVRYADLEDVFVGGLLHDVGKILLDEYAHTDLKRALDLVASKDCSLREAEQMVFQCDHSEFGGWLAERWNLPPLLIESIRCHHEPAKALEAKEVVAMVHLGNAMARMKKIGSGGDDKVPPVKKDALAALNLEPADLTGIIDQIDAEIEKAKVFFELPAE